jgi:hypothetical protein
MNIVQRIAAGMDEEDQAPLTDESLLEVVVKGKGNHVTRNNDKPVVA